MRDKTDHSKPPESAREVAEKIFHEGWIVGFGGDVDAEPEKRAATSIQSYADARVAELKAEIEDLKKRCADLKAQNENLKKYCAIYKM